MDSINVHDIWVYIWAFYFAFKASICNINDRLANVTDNALYSPVMYNTANPPNQAILTEIKGWHSKFISCKKLCFVMEALLLH